MNTRTKLHAFNLTAAVAGLFFTACYAVDDSGTYVDHTNDSLLAAADGRLADLGVRCRLWPVPGDGTRVEMALDNHGDVAIEFLTRGTAWDRLSPALTVFQGERELPYLGIIASRGSPEPSEFQRIEAGETVARVYHVASMHDGRDAGDCEIALRSPILNIRVEGVA